MHIFNICVSVFVWIYMDMQVHMSDFAHLHVSGGQRSTSNVVSWDLSTLCFWRQGFSWGSGAY